MKPKLPTKAEDLVLEIGSGHNPHPRSDILVDEELEDNTERQRQALRVDRPLIIADGQRLPFKDKTFDFIYCAQVLEHVEKPLQFVKELGRVGKRGLLVVPDIVRERLFGWSYHRWFFWKARGQIYFAVKEEQSLPHGLLAHKLFAETLWFRRQIQPLDRQLNIYYLWGDKPELKKATKSQKNKQLNLADNRVKQIIDQLEFDWKRDTVFYISWFLRRVISKLKSFSRR